MLIFFALLPIIIFLFGIIHLLKNAGGDMDLTGLFDQIKKEEMKQSKSEPVTPNPIPAVIAAVL